MKFKSYHSDTVEAAIRLASVELGEDAVFLGSRKHDENESDGRYEVTFAVLDQELAAAGRQTLPALQEAAFAAGQSTPFAAEEADSGGARGAAKDELGRKRHANGIVPFPHWRNFVTSEPSSSSKQEVLKEASAPRSNDRRNRQTEVAGEGPAPADPASWDRFLLEGMRETSAAAAPARDPSASADSLMTPSSTWSYRARPFSQTPLTDSLARISTSIEQLRESFERHLLHGPAQFPRFTGLLDDPALARFYSALTSNEVEPELAAKLIAGVRSLAGRSPVEERLRALLVEQLRAFCRTESALGRNGSQPRIAALIGPSGAGKTTTVAKLAIRYGLGSDRRVHLVSVDPLRVGAVEQLEAYANLLDVPLTPVADPEALPGVLQQLSDGGPSRPELILIDTPGYGPAEWPRATRLATTLLNLGSVDTHLVVSLTTKPADLRQSVENYRLFQPKKLLFTRLDETGCFGAVLNESVRTKLPLSFFSTGQQTPEDLAPATEPYLIDLVLKRRLQR